jgi:hypothetical protein
MVISRRQQLLEALDCDLICSTFSCGCPYGGDVGRVYGQGSDAVAFSFTTSEMLGVYMGRVQMLLLSVSPQMWPRARYHGEMLMLMVTRLYLAGSKCGQMKFVWYY